MIKKYRFINKSNTIYNWANEDPEVGKLYTLEQIRNMRGDDILEKVVDFWCKEPNPDWEIVIDPEIEKKEILDAVNNKALRYNEGKPQYSLIDLKSLEPMAKVLEFGANKYARNNWKKGMPITKILDSMLRHIAALQSGEWLDSESGLPHIGHIQCNALFLGGPNVEIDIEELKQEPNV